MNLAWSWNRDARVYFREINESLWNRTRHNPIMLLQQASPERLEYLATDPAFCARYDRLMAWHASEKSDEHTWYVRTFPELRGKPSRTSALSSACTTRCRSTPVALACWRAIVLETACSIGVPVVAVGILYRHGYFDQRIRTDGWQEDSDDNISFNDVPLEPIAGPDGRKTYRDGQHVWP